MSSTISKTVTPFDNILSLHKAMGNRAVEQLLKSGVIQAKLTISQPNDIYEQEADRVADQGMRMRNLNTTEKKGVPTYDKSPSVQGMCTQCDGQLHRNTEGVRIQRMCTECEEELRRQTTGVGEEVLQMKEISGEASEVSPNVESEINSIRGGGQPLPESVRALFEPRFGQDFGHVRIHTGQVAAATSQSLQAAAFTYGSDIFFNAGQYRPDTTSGFGLLAHELTHVAQQHDGGISRRLIQRDKLPYHQVTWADFKAQAPQDAPESAGILSAFELPSFSVSPDTKNMKTKCKIGKTPSTIFKATISLDPAQADKLEAYMDTDRSWLKDRYKDNGNAYCTGQATQCESAFDSNAAQARTTCQQYAAQCEENFRRGRNFGYEIGGETVTIDSKADCTTPRFHSRCQALFVKQQQVSLGSATAKTKADCKNSFFKKCIDNEKVQMANLLKHEQGHFDITKVMADKARASVKAKVATVTLTETACGQSAATDAVLKSYDKMEKELDQLVKDWLASKDKAQDDYDGKTDHGLKAAEQKAWEAKIKGGLKEYDPTTAPPPAAAPKAPATPPSIPAPTTKPPATPSPVRKP